MLSSITIVSLIAASCTTISFLPQALQTIKTKNTKGISLPMYSLFTFGTTLWFIFGLMIQNYPIVLANGITTLLALIILICKIKYK
jgi:MtN3 and saliva related transmembrane protein